MAVAATCVPSVDLSQLHPPDGQDAETDGLDDDVQVVDDGPAADDTSDDGVDGADDISLPEADADAEADADLADDAPTYDADAGEDADACVPDCTSRECGDDGCGGTCGPGCGAIESCTAAGHCAPTAEAWIEVPPGTFLMGSPSTEAGRYDIETQHQVTLTRCFAIPEAEVTQTQFFDLVGYDPAAHTGCPNCPVEMVNWHEAAAYCNALSTAAGRATCFTCSGSGASVTCTPSASYATPYNCPGYRLPTEAEWEYAARAGTTAATYGGDLDLGHIVCEEPNPTLDPIAWFCGNAGGTTHQSRSLDPNPWGLYDMLGNVWEWTSDWFVDDLGSASVSDPTGGLTGTYRTVRGGCWNHVAAFARSAERGVTEPALRVDREGFRPVRTLP